MIGVPGDTVSAAHGFVSVDGKKADSIQTLPFPTVHLGHGQYFVLGDNRSASQDSRVFGPVPRKAIYARLVLSLAAHPVRGSPATTKSLPARPSSAPNTQVASV